MDERSWPQTKDYSFQAAGVAAEANEEQLAPNYSPTPQSDRTFQRWVSSFKSPCHTVLIVLSVEHSFQTLPPQR